ncbi:acyl-CoA dehydrogenase family protein [Bacillus swezeyi]|uniref:Acyl-CoA dehydrogenase n=1 Tax=Bacillus swezeyi TaxID=1925020 RepID=A0A5M8RGD9_9BACI|nr:acyl-CoA dehydrogenase family protein [Bacillus swezeyi]KAA6447677.1 acyl-CoA dehydrogenase [Bacillus swezeyi]KAA6473947.1 acyl-CoA dehydrogenase [Bacillus swezeyi]TYS34260.1 acyl-CoA dehydrogenase [Bacillus swezeyi]
MKIAEKQAHDVIESFRKYCNERIRPYAGEFDEKEWISDELIKDLGSKSFFAAGIPAEYHGLGLDPVQYGSFTEQAGKACCNIRTLLTVNSLVGESLLRYGTERQKEEWLVPIGKGTKIGAFALSEPNIGSDANHVETSYIKKGDRYVINGRKKWISFGALADFFIVIARQEDAVTAFIVDRHQSGVKVQKMTGMMANRASYLAEIDFDEVEVAAEQILGPLGGGFNHIVSLALDHGRYSVAWAGLAIAQEAVDSLITYSRKRSQFGEKLYKHQIIKGMIGDAVTQLHAARALCMKAGEMRKKQDPEAITETSIAKYFTSKIAVDISNMNVQVHGGSGFSKECSAARLYREAKVLEVIEGTSQIQQQVIANYGLRKYYVKHA